MLQAGVAVVERDPAVEGLVDLHLGAREAEAACLLGNLEAAALPLHDVVVADDAFMQEAADAVDIFRSGPPRGGRFARRPGETAVVVGDEFAQHDVGGVEVLSGVEAEFTAQAILQHAPEAFDAAFGLRAVGDDEGDAELFQRAAELGGLAFSGQLFFHGPKVVVADKDAAVIAVKCQRHTEATQQLAKQAEIAESGFRGEELRGQDFAGGVVLHAESGDSRVAAFEPVVRTTVELHQFAKPRGTHAALSRRAQAVLAEQTAQGFTAEGKALALDQFLAKMVVVEADISAPGQLHDAPAHGVGQAAVAGPAAVGVSQSRLPVFAHAFLQGRHGVCQSRRTPVSERAPD